MVDLLPIFNPTHPQLTCRVPLPEKAIQHQQHNLVHLLPNSRAGGYLSRHSLPFSSFDHSSPLELVTNLLYSRVSRLTTW